MGEVDAKKLPPINNQILCVNDEVHFVLYECFNSK